MSLIVLEVGRGTIPARHASLVTRSIFPSDERTSRDFEGNHDRRLMLLPEFELDQAELVTHDRVNIGTASLYEIRGNANRTGRRSAGVASLRMVGGHRSEYIPPMYDDVEEFIGDDYDPGQPRKFRITDYDDSYLSGKPLTALTIEFKQNLTTTPDDHGNLYGSRHRATVRLDTRSVDPNTRRVFQEAAPNNHGSALFRLRRIQDFISDIISSQMTHPAIEAAKLDIYMHNPETRKQIDARDRSRRQSDRVRKLFDTSQIAYFIGGTQQTPPSE